ncbi:helix-turn-helix domain-containing protein (plasmid) [Azospirillum baldaniorum]|uniref:Helix-turn-helix domain-containing protein n=1 Tax=Azospirillum baldaniorum TaxID=1064539 RepID=A0A9P1NQK4_9PROT|nr:helix-turn-helix domain-containing protein [Azospirillum baldaniorum]AWJ93817.1 helix-turn-helix domain-containing protein [Azospirillum baldaniorum]TWA81640.1 helix-turn-helix protein [Azospirillum brasilense]CCD01970.1 protein of unknown function [Azospirillum baldaniorum]
MPRFAVAHGDWFGPNADANEIAVLTSLALMANPDGVCWPRQSKLAAMLGRSRKWVNSVIGGLKLKGLVEVIKNEGRGLTYRLVGHAALVKERRDTNSDSRCNRPRTAGVTAGNTEQNQESEPLNSEPEVKEEPVEPEIQEAAVAAYKSLTLASVTDRMHVQQAAQRVLGVRPVPWDARRQIVQHLAGLIQRGVVMINEFGGVELCPG